MDGATHDEPAWARDERSRGRAAPSLAAQAGAPRRRGPRHIALRAQPPPGQEGALFAIARLMAVTPAEFKRARMGLAMLGDPGRRTLVERLSQSHQGATVDLEHLTGMTANDVRHRLRGLVRVGMLTRHRHHIYGVDPQALAALRKYADLLIAAAALSTGTRRHVPNHAAGARRHPRSPGRTHAPGDL